MTRKWLIACAALVATLTYVAMSVAAPKPATLPPPGTWQLELELHGAPQRILVTLPGDPQPKTYWYLLYTVINDTGRDIEFYPQFDLFTDTFKSYHADVKPRDIIFETIRKQYESTLPLLEPSSNITGTILQGRDNARDSVAVFDDFDPNANTVRIFASGLSNESLVVDLPADPADKASKKNNDNSAPKNKSVLLRKTLMLEYQVPGDRLNPENRVMLYRLRKWIMR